MNNKIKNFIIFSVAILFVYISKIGCPFYKITGFHCPGCGLTRCIGALLKFDFYQAFRYNPLIIILMIILVIYFIITCLVKKKQFSLSSISDKTWYLLVVITILYGVFRNIDYFSWLAPSKIY